MPVREFPFWQESFLLWHELAGVVERSQRRHEPFYRMLGDAAAAIPPALVLAHLTEDVIELRSLFDRVFANLQTIAWALFVIGTRGDIGYRTVCDYLYRCVRIACGMLVYYRENCV